MKYRYLTFLQSTTTPYRTELFNKMDKVQREFNVSTNVLYYKKMMGNRQWEFDSSKLVHKYKIFDCFEFFIKNYPFYFSVKLVNYILKDKKSDIVLGVSWNDFIVIKIVLLKRMGLIKNKLHFWTEANYMAGSMKNRNWFKMILRRLVFNTIDGNLIIPGHIAQVTVKKYWKLNHKLVYLPNTVEINFDQDELKKMNEKKINILMVARLYEKDKGILNFFKSIKKEDLKSCNFFIAGDGPDRHIYEQFIINNGYKNIFLLGNISREEVLEYYKSTDFFVLPSFSDPNPLSIIEALAASRPVLISNQAGNSTEAVENNLNGYLFNPYDRKDIRNKFSKILLMQSSYNKMGAYSKRIFDDKFQATNILKSFFSNFI